MLEKLFSCKYWSKTDAIDPKCIGADFKGINCFENGYKSTANKGLLPKIRE